MENLELQLLTPQGLETFSGPTGSSTIDFTFASEDLVEDFIKCQTLDTQHGSNHQAVETQFNIATPYQEEKLRLLYKSVLWNKIREKVKDRISSLTIEEKDVNMFTSKLLAIVSDVIHDLVPVSKPSLYA